MTTNNFPDGVAEDAVGWLPNPPAPETLLPPVTSEELEAVAGPGGAIGPQPITSTNPDGDYPGIPLMALGRPESD